MDLRLSIALVTRNRPDSLRACLESVRSQSLQPFEIIVSDDSDEAVVPEVQSVSNFFGCTYRTGPRRGLYANRNAVALACRGTHIRTMDDDHTFPAGHFTKCHEALESDCRAIWACDEIGFVEGRKHAGPSAAPQLQPAGVGGPVVTPDRCWAIADGASMYPREIFDHGLRLTEDFGYGSSYLEFGAYVYRHGYYSRLLRSTHVNHFADASTLSRRSLPSVLHASLCFNLYFDKNFYRALKYGLSYLARSGACRRQFSHILRAVKARWSNLSDGINLKPNNSP